ncbi:MAG: glycosyltransferase family 4 protein [Candidatus Sungiibacteriota bacterium]|uniref:Glycosyltransferase family 4 protein n=1 Tax=Candidatus Sungiibacteriota bacterium TaxID=2750080 RepID=A0A7T5RJC9_9BACT|nr:MAG: glycosyltransferase family 4 protein [Candidatus Sungbacteria bacterium]
MAYHQKVLYVITKSVWGGAQRYIFDLATNLPGGQFEVVVATGGSGPLFDKLQKAGVRTITIPGLQRDINLWKELVSLWYLFKIFVREKPDIIHLNSSKVGGLGAIAAFAAKLTTYNLQLTTIFTVHGWPFNEKRPWWQKKFIRFLSWLGALFQDKIILINTADLNAAKQFIPSRKLALIYNGIGPVNFMERAAARNFFAEKLSKKLETDTIIIGTIAEFTPNKGLTGLLQALHNPNYAMSNIRCLTLLIGWGEERSKLQNLIQEFGLHGSVFLVDFLPEAAHYLKGFDIFILPSLKEGLPYTIMEAMQAGLPIVATSVGGIPDMITHQHDGLLIPPQDPLRLTQTLDLLLRDVRLRKTLGENARKKSETRFRLRDMIENMIKIYA